MAYVLSIEMEWEGKPLMVKVTSLAVTGTIAVRTVASRGVGLWFSSFEHWSKFSGDLQRMQKTV